VAFRKQLIEVLSVEPRTVTRLARELGLPRRDVEDDLRHMIRSARAAGHDVIIEPARCRACGFLFDDDKLAKPSRCPSCRSTWLYEPVVSVKL
jgi:predicted Zn-ribbon and HTH transcriptional regulator